MAKAFEVSILSVKQVHTLPGIWPPETLRALLTLVEFEDSDQIDDKDLPDMTTMALQDLGNQLAGERVLEIIFGDTMRPGVRQNLVDDLQQDEPWEDFAVVAQQRGLFVAVVLLQQAFPNRYAVPDALALQLTIQGKSDGDGIIKLANDPAWLLRLLAQGMPETAPLKRLYETEIQSGPFEDAAGLIWHCNIGRKDANEPEQDTLVPVDLIGSYMWFESLTRGMQFQGCVRDSYVKDATAVGADDAAGRKTPNRPVTDGEGSAVPPVEDRRSVNVSRATPIPTEVQKINRR